MSLDLMRYGEPVRICLRLSVVWAGVISRAAWQSTLSAKDHLMAIERTFSIIKPDATARNLTGAINAIVEQAGLRIVAQKRVRMTREQAETFYAIHRQRPFFG